MSEATIVGLGCIVVLVLAVTWVLAPKGEKRVAFGFLLGGVMAAGFKIAVVQEAPQWKDSNPDSITYELNAQAFAEHWRGKTVSGEKYDLRGLVRLHAARRQGATWEVNDRLSYASIMGSYEWLYAAYIGLWYWSTGAPQTLVIWSNALWAAFFPSAAFGIALALGAPRKWALVAGGLTVLEPSAGVNASWLLKDTLAGFLAMATLWGLVAHLREGGIARLFASALALCFLGGVRYVAFLGLLIAVMLLAVWALFQKRTWQGLALISTIAVAMIGVGVLYAFPQSITSSASITLLQSVLPVKGAPDTLGARDGDASADETVIRWKHSLTQNLLFSPVKGALDTLGARDGDASADETVIRWKHSLTQNLLFSVVKSLARTLFAPYPWVAVHPGLNWHSFSELYYPGVLLWIVCLPGIFVAIALGVRHGGVGFWLVLLFLASQLVAYTIWLGEFSTRQRVFVLPVFFALASIGWPRLIAWLRFYRRRGA